MNPGNSYPCSDKKYIFVPYLSFMEESARENICDIKVFRAVFDAHSQDLYNFLYYKFGDENHPEDLVQEAFMKLWNNCKNVPFEKARSFLFTVARNQMLNELSKKKTMIRYSREKPKNYTPESPQYLMEHDEYMNRLQDAIGTLTEEQRVAFLLNRIEGKKHKEIAEILGISRKAVEKRIYNALRILSEKMRDK
jgi:RNA polymerase sigma-70 factor (ECF subfamily)